MKNIQFSNFIKFISLIAFLLLSKSTIVFSQNGGLDYSQNIENQIENLLQKMTLKEKIGQMTQVNKGSIDKDKDAIKNLFIGSILSGGGEYSIPNSPKSWLDMVNNYQSYALSTRLKIPLIYGVDAVHGHGNLMGAVIFPHNIGLGASRDSNLVQEIGLATAHELTATGVLWNFAPAVSVPHDIRWGRTYEGFSEETNLVSVLSSAYILGLQKYNPFLLRPQVLGTIKHFIGDGGTTWGSSHNENYHIDQGDTNISESDLRRKHLSPYINAIANGARTVMVSYSSWQGEFMHGHRYLINDVLKKELGFTGLVISDWLGVFMQKGLSVEEQITSSINAGIDMVMAVDQYKVFTKTLYQLVISGHVPMERINDAVRRILRIKYEMNLFQNPFHLNTFSEEVGSIEHRKLSRKAAQKSLVLLKNENVLPLRGPNKKILLFGSAANDIGLQCGAWTLEWQGHRGNVIPGSTLLDGLNDYLPDGWNLDYIKSASEIKNHGKADYSIVVLAEEPYAEGHGDNNRLELSYEDKEIINLAKKNSHHIILILYSGRPLIIKNELQKLDAFVAAWLPGSEAGGIAEVLFGKKQFQGKLPFTWPKSLDDYSGKPIQKDNVLYPFGFGLN